MCEKVVSGAAIAAYSALSITTVATVSYQRIFVNQPLYMRTLEELYEDCDRVLGPEHQKTKKVEALLNQHRLWVSLPLYERVYRRMPENVTSLMD